MFFLAKNWKALVFPGVCCYIICFDYFFGFGFGISLIKILVFSFFHFLYVYKTQYIYNSDIYIYLNELKIEYERKHIIKPFLTSNQSTLITFSLLFFICIKDYNPFIFCFISCFACLLILDAINVFGRSLTNKAELNQVKVPVSLKQTRFMFTAFTKFTPNCVALGKLVVGSLTCSELVYPAVVGNGNTLGPVMKIIDNNLLHPDLKLPIETKLDHCYESYKADFDKFRPESKPLPDRTQILFEKQDILNLGVTAGQIEIMTGNMSSTSPVSFKK
jgi:hypothetical protein